MYSATHLFRSLRPKPPWCLAYEYTQTMADKHDPLELEWFQLGLSGPARRALVNAKLYKVSDLRKISLDELLGMHGMGKSSVARIRVIMDAKKIRFRP
jgi:hypothetical protein